MSTATLIPRCHMSQTWSLLHFLPSVHSNFQKNVKGTADLNGCGLKIYTTDKTHCGRRSPNDDMRGKLLRSAVRCAPLVLLPGFLPVCARDNGSGGGGDRGEKKMLRTTRTLRSQVGGVVARRNH